MTYGVNWFGVADDSSHVLTVERDPDPSTDAAQNGVYLSPLGELVCTQVAVSGSDTFQRGIAVAPTGAMRVLLVNGSAPSGSTYDNGFLISSTGQLCVTTDSVDHYVKGIPLNVYGAVCIVGSTPPTTTISSIVLTQNPNDDAGAYYLSQLYYGASGATVATTYTSKTAFNSDNPAAALETFASIAPHSGNVSFAGGSIAASPTAAQLNVSTAASLPGPSTYAAFNMGISNTTTLITFTPPISAAGLNIAYLGGHGRSFQADFYDGATLLSSQVIPTPASPLSNPTWSFFGYAVASGGPPATQNRVTDVGDTRTTDSGDTRVYV